MIISEHRIQTQPVISIVDTSKSLSNIPQSTKFYIRRTPCLSSLVYRLILYRQAAPQV